MKPATGSAPLPRDYTQSFKSTLVEGARGVNANLQEGESPIVLPTSYGGKGSYVLRFLYGHRIIERGGTYEDIAYALGNSAWAARKHYQDEQQGEVMNRVTRRLRDSQPSDPTTALAELQRELEEEWAKREALEAKLTDAPPEASGNGYAQSLTCLLQAKQNGEISGGVFRVALASLNEQYGIDPSAA